MNKQTIGKIIADNPTTDIIYADDVMGAETKRYWDHVLPHLEIGKKKFTGDYFFIEVCLKKERLLPDLAPRILAISRQTCPTPNYDQHVYIYNKKDDALDLVWSLPDRETALGMYTHPLEIHPDEKELLQYIMEWADGTLFKIMKKFNNEKMDSNELDKSN